MQINNELDKELLMYLKQASKDKPILKEKTFIKYCEDHYYNFTDWYNHVENYMCNQYQKMGKLTYEEVSGKFLFFNIHAKKEVLEVDDSYCLILRSVLGLNDNLDDRYDDGYYYYVYHVHGFVHNGVEAHDNVSSSSSLGGGFSGGGGGGTR